MSCDPSDIDFILANGQRLTADGEWMSKGSFVALCEKGLFFPKNSVPSPVHTVAESK